MNMNYGSNVNYAGNSNMFQGSNVMAAQFNTNTNPSMGLNANVGMNMNMGMNASMQNNARYGMNDNMLANSNSQMNMSNPINSQSMNMHFSQPKAAGVQSNLNQINVNQFMTAPLPQPQSFQNKQPSFQPQMNNVQPQPQRPNVKERLYLKLSNEERGFFSNLFEIADVDKKGKLPGKVAAEFLKKSNLPKEALKQIWYIAAQTDPNLLERDEFYIALRLVALAQSNFPITVDVIRNNTPLPPLPVFNLKKNASSSQVDDDIETTFALSEGDIQKYTRFFNTSKEQENKLSIPKACQMWKSTNVNEETIGKILLIVNPLKENGFLNLKEFIVCTLFVFKSFHKEIPKALPKTLATYLFGDHKPDVPQFSPNQQQQSPQKELQLQPQQLSQGQSQSPSSQFGQVNQVNRSTEHFQLMNTSDQQQQRAMGASLPEEEVFDQTDQDLLLVTGLVEDIEKATRAIEAAKRRNEQLKQQIKEVYDDIKARKGNLIKLTLMIPQRHTEIEIAQEELNKMKASYFGTLDEKGQLEIEYMKEKEGVSRAKEELPAQSIVKEEQQQKEQYFLIGQPNSMSSEKQVQRDIDPYSAYKPPIEVKGNQEEVFDPYAFIGAQTVPKQPEPKTEGNPLMNDFNFEGDYQVNQPKQGLHMPYPSLKPSSFQFDQNYNHPQPEYNFKDNKPLNPQENNYLPISNQFGQMPEGQDFLMSSIESLTRNDNAPMQNSKVAISNPFQPATNNRRFGFEDDFGKYNANFEEKKNNQKEDWDF